MATKEKKAKRKEKFSKKSTESKQESDRDTEVESETSESLSKSEQNSKTKSEYTAISSSTVSSKLRKSEKTKKEGKIESSGTKQPKSSRMLILFRNAEQMDKIFPDWIHKSFVEGKYVPNDMNQPMQLPIRKTPLAAFDSDPPLTEMGIRISQLMGKALAESGIVISAIYSSPSLRCIQTAQNLIKSQLFDLKIRVEPAFYDFAGVQGGKEIPYFMSVKELLENNFPIDKDYQPITATSKLSKFAAETSAEFFKRQSNNIYTLTKQSPSGTVMIVTHASTMHAVGREIIGKSQHSLNSADMQRIPFNYPYCSALALKPAPDGLWTIASQALPILNFSHFSNRFNYHFFAKSV